MTTLGKLYVFEGPDGVGKSTLAQWFASHLQESGYACTLLSFPGKEDGTLGEHVYELHHDPARFGIQSLSAASLQLLHVAAHIDAIETRIKPLLNEGERWCWTVSGGRRSYMASLAAYLDPCSTDGRPRTSVW